MLRHKKLSRFDIITLLLSILLYIGIANAPFKAKPFGDLDFHIETKIMVRFFWGQESGDAVSITKAPGPVLFYLLPYFLAGPNASDNHYWFAGIIWTGLWMTVSLFFIRRAGENLGSITAGKVAVILILLFPLHIYYSLGILAEGLAFLGCCIMIYGYAVVYANRNDHRFSLWWPFIIGCVCIVLARPNAILIFPLFLIFIGYQVLVRKDAYFKSMGKRFAKVWLISVLLVFLVMIIVKQLPNQRQTLKQEAYLSYVAMIGRFQFREETWDWRFWDGDIRGDSKDYHNWNKAVTMTTDIDPQKNQSNQYHFIVNDVIEHPLVAMKQFGIRTLFGHMLHVSSIDKSSFGIGPVKGKWVYWIFHILLNLFNLLIVLCAMGFLFTKDALAKAGIIFMPWLALILFHGIIYMEQRYLFPVRPVIIVLASLFIVTKLQGRHMFKFLNEVA